MEYKTTFIDQIFITPRMGVKHESTDSLGDSKGCSKCFCFLTHLLSTCCMLRTVPGVRFKTALWADMRMNPSLAGEEYEAQRFQVHPRSLGQRRQDMGCNLGRAHLQPSPFLPISLLFLLNDPGTLTRTFVGGPRV